jgi:hypothetical protein
MDQLQENQLYNENFAQDVNLLGYTVVYCPMASVTLIMLIKKQHFT